MAWFSSPESRWISRKYGPKPSLAAGIIWAQRGWTQIRRKECSMPIAGCMEFPIFSLPGVRYSRRWAATCRRSPSWPWHCDLPAGLRLPWALRTWEVNRRKPAGDGRGPNHSFFGLLGTLLEAGAPWTTTKKKSMIFGQAAVIKSAHDFAISESCFMGVMIFLKLGASGDRH